MGRVGWLPAERGRLMVLLPKQNSVPVYPSSQHVLPDCVFVHHCHCHHRKPQIKVMVVSGVSAKYPPIVIPPAPYKIQFPCPPQ